MKDKFEKIKNIAERALVGSDSAHNIDHVMRVYNLCLHLAKGEKVDLEVLKAAALLHDVARVKEDSDNSGKTDHALLGAKMAKSILKKFHFTEKKIRHIQNCIVSHRYRTGNEPDTLEAKILFDSDKLDTIGAIGVARSFVWVGHNDAKIYSDVDIDKYAKINLGGKLNGRIRNKKLHSPQIEYKTKLIFLSKKLHTKKAKGVCKKRLKFYDNFLRRLEKEIKGEL